ncbi:uncharacterized protein LOC143040234 [Oratosquilla oratoria]|uniref:uncharacterized protein LOC143021937 n=1 Tax=Oratosquilla oratoria TaxID=337810 RepID=UPI003F77267D
MEYSGSEAASSLEQDLMISDTDDDISVNHWPDLPRPTSTPHHPPTTTQHDTHQSTSLPSTKRRADDTSTFPAGECQPPAAKTIKGTSSLHHNTKVDRLAKEACRLPRRGDGRPLSLLCYLNRVRSAALLPEQRRRDTERPFSVTITHYESVCRHKYKYRRKGLMVRRHNVVSARLRLGYRPPWQVAGVEGEPVFTECRLCHAPLANTIEHYCLACPTVKHLIPQGLPLDAICRHLLSQNRLDEILVRYPRFGGFS